MGIIDNLLNKNNKWASNKINSQLGYFEKLSESHTPKILWIGCCDSRLSPEVITATDLGKMLVHRNIANQVLPNDLNVNAIIQFGLDVLNIKTIIVAGHYNCGGIEAFFKKKSSDEMAAWLFPLNATYKKHVALFEKLTSVEQQLRLMSELNVRQQVINLADNKYVKQQWQAKQNLSIHGLISELKNGRLLELDMTLKSISDREHFVNKKYFGKYITHC